MNRRSALFGAVAVCVAAGCGSESRDGDSPRLEGGSAGGPALVSGGAPPTGTGGAATSLGGVGSGGIANGGAATSNGGALANGGTATSNGGSAASGGAPGTGGAVINGTIVPLYSYPTDPAWPAIERAKAAHPDVAVVAIVNPDSGPGSKVDAAYTRGIAALASAGIVPIGYVSTDYTRRGEPAVKADIDRWHAQYPSTQGIFFDEQSNTAGDEGFYRSVSSYAKSVGLSLTVGNPGTSVPASFLDALDVMLIYETAGTPPLSNLTRYAPRRTHYGIIPYAAPLDAAYVTSAMKSVAYVYVTDDDLPNPWDTLPAFFDSLLAALAP